MSFKNIIQFNLEKRWFVLGFFLLLTALAATQIPKLEFDFSPEAMLEFSDEEIAYQNEFNEKFHTNPDIFLIVFSSPDSLVEPKALADLRDLTDMVADTEGIDGVFSLSKVPDSTKAGPAALLRGNLPLMIPPEGEIDQAAADAVKKRIDKSTTLKGNLISKNERHALITLSVNESAASPSDFYPIYEDIAERIADWQQDGRGKYEITYGGLPYIRAVTVDTMQHEQLILWPIVGLLYVIAMIIMFRSFWQAIIPLACIGCVIVWSVSLMVVNKMPVTMINNTLPLLILVIGVTNGIYVIMRILDERTKGKDKKKAITDGVYRVALATLLTTSTTSIGFGSLLVAKTKILNGFGGITALAVMFIYVAIIFFMPQVLSLIGVDPKRSKYGSHHDDDETESGQHVHAVTETADSRFERFLDNVAKFTIRHRVIVIGGAVVLLCASIAVASQIRFNSKVNDVFQEEHPISVTNRLIEEQLGGMLPVEIDLIAKDDNYFRSVDNLAKICAFEKELTEIDGILSTVSICDFVTESGVSWDNPPNQTQLGTILIAMKRLQPSQFLGFMTEDGSNIHISMRIPDNGFEISKVTISEIRKAADAAFAGMPFEYRLTGIGYNSTLGLDHFMSDLFTSLLTAFLIIFSILFISFRSFWSGAVAILPNLLPIALTLAFLPIYGYSFNTTTVLVFTISIGLSVDNSIHIIQRFRQEYRGERTVEEAIRQALRSSGRAIVQSNVMLCSGLAILLLSDFDPIGRVGLLTITTIGAALVVSIILLPAEIACVGKKMKLPRFKNNGRGPKQTDSADKNELITEAADSSGNSADSSDNSADSSDNSADSSDNSADLSDNSADLSDNSADLRPGTDISPAGGGTETPSPAAT